MTTSFALSTPPDTLPRVALADPPARVREAPPVCVRLAVHGDGLEPPRVDEIRERDPAAAIEETVERVLRHTALPALAVREIVENLVHAGFSGATVTVLDGGRVVRVSDTGPGITDLERALAPGYSTADEAARRVIRGVGSGLPLAGGLLRACGGRLDVGPNLGRGTVVSMSAPVGQVPLGEAPLGETARRLLALLVEVGPAAPAALAGELDVPLGECGRELALLEHRGLVTRAADGGRTLTGTGSALVATLF
ncbi:MAG: ATP-binding protein [Actinomycetota bacterium]